jgi:predicted metal-dependent hydrolase
MKINLDQQNIEIIKTNRKGSIGLKVEPNRIALMVPKHFADTDISSFIKSEKDWLLAKIAARKQNMPKQISFKSGTQLLLFGNKILYKEDHHRLVKKIDYQFNEEVLVLFCKQTRPLKNVPASARKVAISFFIKQLETVINSTILDLAKIIQVTPSIISIKNYKSKWGSCCADGSIQFNWRLAMAPKSVIEYVIIHELCHLIHPNHSKDYWQTVAKFCPTYQQEKQWLKENGASLMSL